MIKVKGDTSVRELTGAKPADSFGNEAYSTKIMEFMSLGVPLVLSDTKIDRYYFHDSGVRFFESGNVDALAKAMIELLEDPESRRQMSVRGLEYARQNSGDTRKDDYLRLVDQMVARKGRPTPWPLID